MILALLLLVPFQLDSPRKDVAVARLSLPGNDGGARGVVGTALVAGVSEAPSPATPEEAFSAAESLYHQGRYEEAAARFEGILSRGIDDGVVHYNLANAYFKDGRVGRAVLHYERALRRMPSDEDARVNLEYARERIRDGGSGPPLPPFVAGIVRLYGKLGPSFWAFVLSVSFVSGTAALSLLLWPHGSLRPRAKTPLVCAASLAAAVALLAASALAAKLHAQAAAVEAIVLSPRAELRSGPAPSYPRLAEAEEGWKVTVLGSREGWVQVSLSGGLTGWIQSDRLETID